MVSLVLELVRKESAADPFAFSFAPQDYLLRGASGSFEVARFPWDEALLDALHLLRTPGRDPALAQRIGEALRHFVSQLGWPEHESQLLQAVAKEQPITVTIRSAAAELYALPWELLTLKSTGQHLGELPGVQLRYEWPDTQSAPERTSRPEGGRILVAWSAAAGAVPAAEHVAAIQRACVQGSHPFAAERDVLPHVSCSQLTAALAAAEREGPPIDVLHILCHGTSAGSTFGLVFDGDPGLATAAVVDAGTLRQLLAPYAKMVRLVVLSACDSSNSGAPGNHLGSVAQALHRAGFAAVVASRYPLSATSSIRLTEALYGSLLVEMSSLEQALRQARLRLARDARQLDWASIQLYARAADGDDTRPLLIRPYRGLLAFLPEHGRLFFGRQREATEIAAALTRLGQRGAPRFLIVAGASGTGKSSVVMAGALPLLLASHAGTGLLRMRPGATPEQTLEELLTRRGSGPHILFIDQLEELFTHTAAPAARQSFIRKLWQLACDRDSALSVLATLRVDFIGRCGELVVDDIGRRMDSIAYDEAHRLFVGQLAPESLRQAIEEPARKVGLQLEEGLASRMLADVEGEPGALPLVADTLDLLWQRRAGRTLTQDAYTQLGGVTGALRGRIEALLRELDDGQRQAARRLLVRLVSVGDDAALATRRRVALCKLRPQNPSGHADQKVARFERVLGLLLQARLLVLDGEEAAQSVEVAHEALIRGWQQLLTWVREDRALLAELEKLETWVAEWKRHQVLLTGAQLASAIELAARCTEELTPDATELLQRSRRRARWVRRLRTLAVTSAVAAMLLFAYLYAAARQEHEKTLRAEKSLLDLIGHISSKRPRRSC